MPDRIHEVQPSRSAAGYGPIDGIAQDCDGPVETGIRLTRPIRVVERRQCRADRMRIRIRPGKWGDYRVESVSCGGQIECDGSNEDEQQLASHGIRAHRESAATVSPRWRAAMDWMR